MRKKVGIYGGSFDPIHLGHLNLAVRLKEKCHLDEVLFCPAHVSPFKQNTPPTASNQDRLEMIKLAIDGFSWMQVSSIELDRPPPSFMIETVSLLKKENLDTDYFLILASDHLPHMHGWKDIDFLLKQAKPLVGKRERQDIEISAKLQPEAAELIKRGICQIPILDITSTEIRERLGSRLYCGHMVLSKVLDYITSHHLYSSSYE